MRYYQKLMLLIVGLHLAGGVATAQVTIGGSVYGGGNKAQVTGMVKVDLEAGTVDKSVYGGGNQAGINGSTVVTITGGTVANNATGETYGVYGGCNANGNVSGDISVSIQGGTLGTENKRLKGIFGGGYGHLTTTGGNVTVTIGDKEGNHTPVLYSDLYGGSALGKVNAGGKKTQVNFLNGTLHGNLYGGGLGKANDVDSEGNITTNNADSGRVNGIVIVNIGDSTQTDDQCQVVLRGRNVYGCNNTNGSPQDSVYVNIYKTAHTSTDLATEDATAYAIEQVFGGGRNANYTAATGKAATVNVYTCDNSVRQVFGGGDAADATGVAVTIYGGHFAQVFGGGNGASEPANIGAGGANTQIHGGYIGQLFGGSNKQGTITGPMRTKVDSEGTCPEKIGEFFGGSNEVPITGDIVTTIECGAGNFGDVYGGSNLADITGNITFNIRGGTIGKVFGGSKGSTDKAANITGSVQVNAYGGTLGYVYGGSNLNGNITGTIEVNIDSNQASCALTIDNNVYGGSYITMYQPSSRDNQSPVVNIKHGTVGRYTEGYVVDADHGNVFGGGHGQGSRSLSNPTVNMGNGSYSGDDDHAPVVRGNIYGGGAVSRVFGNTHVNMQEGTVEGNIFAGSKGATREDRPADDQVTTRAIVDGWTTLNMNGGTVKGNLYGGGEIASVDHYSSAAQNNSAEWSKYDSDTENQAKYGTAYINVSGGQVGVPYEGQNSDAKGNIFGGGLGLAFDPASTASFTEEQNLVYLRAMGNVRNTEVNVSDEAYIVGSIYGGGENGHVYDSTIVHISGGTIGKPFTLAERRSTADGQITRNYTGHVYGGGSGAKQVTTSINTESGNTMPVFLAEAGRVWGNTRVLVDGTAHVRGDVMGGGAMASVGDFDVDKSTGIATYKTNSRYSELKRNGIATVTIGGDALIGPSVEDLTKDADGNDLASAVIDTNFKYLGCNEGHVFGSSQGISGGSQRHMSFADSTVVTIQGNAQVISAVYGGGEDGHVASLATVNITGGIVGGIPLHGQTYTVDGGEYDGVEVHLASGEEENTVDEYGTGRRVFRGNVFGGGKGTDFISWLQVPNGTWPGINRYCYSAGRVWGNTVVNISDTAKIYNRVYGGGTISSVGTFENNNASNIRAITGLVAGTGTATVTISGGEIGTDGLNNGEVYGGGRGLPGGTDGSVNESRQMPDEAYVGNTYVIVNGGTIHGSVYGGAANGHVQKDAHVTITDGIIGTPGRGGWVSNVYGGGGGGARYIQATGRTKHSITSGRVFGNTEVTVNGGTILHNVYGGGAVASVGTYNLEDPNNLWVSGGDAEVKILGGTIGTDGHENGMVFGSGRGEVDNSFFDSLAYTTNTIVTIGTQNATTGPKVNGSVYGSGENGHVFKKATVNIHSGTIGCTAEEYAAMTDSEKTDHFPFRGNVYGAGCGTDLTPDGKYNTLAGIVQGNTEVNITGGYISRNVYGAGAMASVGSITSSTLHTDATTSFALSWPVELTYAEGTGTATVNVTGGHIGTVSAPEGTSGDIYGSSRGEAGDRYTFVNLANVRTSSVTINFTPSDDDVIVGSVYGSGENGHVYEDAHVTLTNGLINGSLYGGGKGSDKYTDQLKDQSTDALYGAEVYDITAGKVYGNTHVVMNGGRVAKNVYGGGNLASVGKGNYIGYGEGTNASDADKLLAENSGHCQVEILGGVIGPDSITNGTIHNNSYSVPDGHVYGAGKGIVFPAATKVGFNYDRNYYVAYVNKASVILGDSTQRSCDYTTTSPHVTGNLFGGGENGHVRFDTYIQTNRGVVGVRPLDATFKLTSDVGHWAHRGNVFGAGRGEDTNPDGSYCQSAGSVTRNTTIDILGARIYRNVQGGGAMASVGPVKGYDGDSSTCVINLRLPQTGDTLGGPSNTNNAFGGYIGGGSRGIPSPDGSDNSALATCHNSQINIYRGRLKNTIYGGGENGQMLGNTEINVYDGYIRSAIYGGGKGCWKTTADDAGLPGTYDNDTLSGYIAGNTTINLLGGEVPFTYGGCRRANVGGNATINIGKVNDDGSYSGEVAFISSKNKVYGGNQYAGTPKGDITVNVYSTAHNDLNRYPTGVNDTSLLMENDANQAYAIGAVYGGSFNSHYLPEGSGHKATVHVYGCENTIQEIYGGAEAADMGAENGVSVTTQLIIDGGRFKRVFGGGNGYTATGNRDKPYRDASGCTATQTATACLDYNPGANVYGTARTIIHSGLITEFFGGSNQLGDITTISTQIDHDNTGCDEVIGNLYSGSNESDIYGNGELIIACGAGKFKEVYGGSNSADIHGNVTLTIRGGEIGNVYAGSKGTNDAAANIDGNVTLNLEGGTITNAFGGSNINGNITGIVTVNVLDTCENCPLSVVNIYGGGNKASYSPTDNTLSSPQVFVKHTSSANTLTGDVYGGGFGGTAIVRANPIVTIGDDDANHTALVGHNVYGGGSYANVQGNTAVVMKNAHSVVSGSIYGGGALANVDGTAVTLNAGTLHGDLYGGGLGRKAGENIPAIAATVEGNVQVTVNGGTVIGGVYGANNLNGAPTGTVKVDVYGTDQPTEGFAIAKVFGGGNQAAYGSTPQVTVHNCGSKIEYVYGGGNEASVTGTNVTIYGSDTIAHVYGGGYGADVTSDGTQVTIHGGTIGDVFGGNNSSGTITGTINVTVEKQTEEGHDACEMHVTRVYGGGNHASSGPGNITVNCTGGDTEGIDTLYGGANQADISGNIVLDINAGRIGNVFGGNNTSGTISGTITVNIDSTLDCAWYVGNVYGGGNKAAYTAPEGTPDYPVVNVKNGTVSENVYGGGDHAKVTGNPQVLVGVKNDDTKSAKVKGSVYGGGNAAHVSGNTNVTLQGNAEVKTNVYGGGRNGDVEGSTHVTLSPQE